MAEAKQHAYDLVEYPDQWYPQSHPDRLATMATLFGMSPTPPERCRVLELGCGSGWNLLAMAATLPESHFVGFDLASIPIEKARQSAATLDLANTSFQALDLAEVDASFGTFDYIVAHGVYSWVPEAVRDRLLEVCSTLLAPQGVAYVSYATYPGRYLTQVVREMLLYYCGDYEDVNEKARHARALLGFLHDAQPDESAYRRLLEGEMKRIRTFPDAFFYHDDLSAVNAPCYFHEFAAHAAKHGLQYLAEANFYEMQDHDFSDTVKEVWQGLAGDVISYEQYRDFLVFRKFRQTLLCREDIAVSRQLDVDRLRRFFAGAPVRRVASQEGSEDAAVERYEGYPESFVESKAPLIQEALKYMGEAWPRFVSFDELLAVAQQRAAVRVPDRTMNNEVDAAEVARLFLELYGGRFLSLKTRQPPLATDVSEQPLASPLARWQARVMPIVTNLLGGNTKLMTPLERRVLPLLDGTRDREALRQDLAELATEDESLADLLSDEQLDTALRRLAYEGLLVA